MRSATRGAKVRRATGKRAPAKGARRAATRGESARAGGRKRTASKKNATKRSAKRTTTKRSTKRRSTKKTTTKRSTKRRSAKKTTTKRSTTKKTTTKRSTKRRSAKKTTTKRSTTKKTTTKRSAKKTATKKAATGRGAPKRAPASRNTKKSATKRGAAKRTPTRRAANRVRADRRSAPDNTRPRAGQRQRATAGTPRLKPVGERKLKPGGVIAPAARSSKRNFGLRGAAPWVARHAAKHAEELRRRNAEPPPPGSARATLRVPPEAETIKSQIALLHKHTRRIKALKRRFDQSFFEIGLELMAVQAQELFTAKGYSSFEAFLDREVDLPRSTSLRIVRICHTFQREVAYDFGLDRLTLALAALDGELGAGPPSHPSSRGFSSASLPIRPPLRFDE